MSRNCLRDEVLNKIEKQNCNLKNQILTEVQPQLKTHSPNKFEADKPNIEPIK